MPVESEVVVILGAGFTVTVVVADLVLSATEVAVTSTAREEVTGGGGLYVALAVVVLVNVPQAAPVHPLPVKLQVTP